MSPSGRTTRYSLSNGSPWDSRNARTSSRTRGRSSGCIREKTRSAGMGSSSGRSPKAARQNSSWWVTPAAASTPRCPPGPCGSRCRFGPHFDVQPRPLRPVRGRRARVATRCPACRAVDHSAGVVRSCSVARVLTSHIRGERAACPCTPPRQLYLFHAASARGDSRPPGGLSHNPDSGRSPPGHCDSAPLRHTRTRSTQGAGTCPSPNPERRPLAVSPSAGSVAGGGRSGT